MAVNLAERETSTQNEVARLYQGWGWGRSQPVSSLIQARFSVSKGRAFPGLPVVSLESEVLPSGSVSAVSYVCSRSPRRCIMRAASAGRVASEPREQPGDPQNFIKRVGGLLGTDIITCTSALGPPCWPITGDPTGSPCTQL